MKEYIESIVFIWPVISRVMGCKGIARWTVLAAKSTGNSAVLHVPVLHVLS